MDWTEVMRSSRKSVDSGNEAAVSRRELLAGIGVTGIFAIAGSALLVTEARAKNPAKEPEPVCADAAETEVAECNVAQRKRTLDTADLSEFSAQPYWRRRRRRSRVVCRRRWVRGRRVRVCRRVWW
jgi:hypothetical protein